MARIRVKIRAAEDFVAQGFGNGVDCTEKEYQSMQITITLPNNIEERLREVSPDLEREAREALALELFRKEKITHYELSQMLGLDRFETDEFLVSHNEYAQSLTLEDLEGDAETLRQLRAKDKRP
jgi:predicted HTH domain antitoxin